MKQERKEIIIDEIEHWRDSRLLPEQYCDFLLNLYQEPKNEKSGSSKLESLKHSNSIPWFLSFGIISLICLIGFYFSAFSLPMQMLTSVIVVGVCYSYASVYKSKSRMVSLVLAGAGSLFMLVLGVSMIALHSWNEGLWIPVLIAVCGTIWLLMGYILKIGLLHYCGIAGWLLLYAVFCLAQVPDATWVQLQLVWLPLAMLFIWLCWLLHKYHKMLSQVYFSMGLTLWCIPEIDMILLRHQVPTNIVLLCVFKVAVVLMVLFFSRKKWIVWVSS